MNDIGQLGGSARWRDPGDPGEPPGAATLADVGERWLLERIGPQLGPATSGARVLVGPGDDAAIIAAEQPVVASTDALVRGRDWRDEWSTPRDVAAKAVAQNLADLAAMGAKPTGLLVTLIADPATTVAWVLAFTEGLGAAAAAAGCSVLGGDLSSAPPGTLAVSVTALGSVAQGSWVCRAGARPGDRVAVCGTLGESAAGLLLLEQGRPDADAQLVRVHRRPEPPLAAGPQAARAGAHAMLDISDGLLLDGARIAAASGVALAFDTKALQPYAVRLASTVGAAAAWDCVLGGGEEHSLLACFPGFSDSRTLPPGWTAIGQVRRGAGVLVDDEPVESRGWDHFGSGGQGLGACDD